MNEAPRINKEYVADLLDHPDVQLIDLRSYDDLMRSAHRIPKAVWEDKDNVESWAAKYDPGKKLILYCA
ncbi:MAG: rhodanese-like domain-containing protein [Syntrophobacteraceae bacterium]